MVSCEESFCSSTYGGDLPGCRSDLPCQYSVLYGDGSSTTGFFVTDVVHYNQVIGDSLTRTANASVTFGYVLFSHYIFLCKSLLHMPLLHRKKKERVLY